MENDDRREGDERPDEAEQSDSPPEATTVGSDQPKNQEVAPMSWGDRVGYGF
jgi:hypothetical protein